MKKLAIILCYLPFLLGCQSLTENSSSNYINRNDLDTLVAPQDNFYLYANGGWMHHEDIPKNRGSWGSYTELRVKNNLIIKGLLTDAYQKNTYKKGSNQYKAAEFFRIGMDLEKREKEKGAPIKPILDQVNEIKTFFDLQSAIIKLHKHQINPFFKPTIFQDLKQPQKQAVYLELSGISIHNTDFYALQDSNSINMRIDYVQHIKKMFMLLGEEEESALKHAKIAYTVEENIAEQYNLSVKTHKNDKYYNPYTIKGLTDICQTFIWEDYFKELGIDTDTVIVTNTTYFSSIDAIILKNGLEKVKQYLKWRLIHFSAPFLSSEFVDEDFRYFGMKRDGLLAKPEEWQRVLDATNKAMGFAVGEIYIEKNFSEEKKQKANDMIKKLLDTAKDRLSKIEWMDPTTLSYARKKLDALSVKVGYPNKFPSYKSFEITPSYLRNVANGNKWLFERKIKKLKDKNVAKKWIITPQTVNAYYHTLHNEFVITAGILQPPFFYPEADDAINYGAIGAVIAHEITHGFDDIGRQYNDKGEIQNWWTRKDYDTFKQRTNRLIAQYDRYEPLPGRFVNGNLTLNENIADISGMALSYATFSDIQKSKGEHDNTIDGFTPEQRFFLSWAKIWRSKTRVQVLRTKLLTETHSPGEFRVNGPLSNFTPFYNAFDVEDSDGMWRNKEDRVSIW
ncbi:M13 family metallopeptidase [Flammeovirga sp. SubArs3]|uniref:M13 family metallopeptidase n=1 Tax=Flammeovirga sp. SubArs3 TaxID=2995316 RepID=UPI00248BC82B|nr:M13 family metallopeptidase [Flammeovirga sp. SubArs3]